MCSITIPDAVSDEDLAQNMDPGTPVLLHDISKDRNDVLALGVSGRKDKYRTI